jgi:hypothetical protein
MMSLILLMCRYSSCISLTEERTPLPSEFVMVECSWPHRVKVIYRGYHGSALAKSPVSSSIQNKVSYWKDKEERLANLNAKPESLPPNILVVGQDSTSRVNFRRNMLKTLELLEVLGAVEMQGYTKGIV